MPTSIELDTIDRHILTLLQQDAAQANQTLAARVGVSPATALRRVRRLVESGVIQRQVALLDPAAVGLPLAAVVEITLDRQGAEHLNAFEARAVAEAAVQQAWRVAPGPDFVLMVQVADMAAFQALTQRLLTQDANVRNVKTYFAIKRAKFETGLQVNAG
jgi:DNA-binding Lrp family transcriptional regulator